MKYAFMASPTGEVSFVKVPAKTQPTAFPMGSQYTLGLPIPLEVGDVPVGTVLTVEAREYEHDYTCFCLDRDIPGWGNYLELMPFGYEDILKAINAGIRRDYRMLDIDPAIVQIRTVVQLPPVPVLWTNGTVTIDANHSPSLLWACLPDGTGMRHNPAWCAHYNMTDEEARMGWKYTAHPDDSPSLLEPWLRSLATGEPYEVEVRRRDRSGEYHWYRTLAVPVFENGKIVKWCGVNTRSWVGRFPRAKAKVFSA